jgi:hypothetical protein
MISASPEPILSSEAWVTGGSRPIRFGPRVQLHWAARRPPGKRLGDLAHNRDQALEARFIPGFEFRPRLFAALPTAVISCFQRFGFRTGP